MSDATLHPVFSGKTIGHFKLRLGTEEEPRPLSTAISELRRYIDRMTKAWSYADPMWIDDSRTKVAIQFKDARLAAKATLGW